SDLKEDRVEEAEITKDYRHVQEEEGEVALDPAREPPDPDAQPAYPRALHADLRAFAGDLVAGPADVRLIKEAECARGTELEEIDMERPRRPERPPRASRQWGQRQARA